jgi:hypothetical protein
MMKDIYFSCSPICKTSVPKDARSIGVPNRAVGCSGKRKRYMLMEKIHIVKQKSKQFFMTVCFFASFLYSVFYIL